MLVVLLKKQTITQKITDFENKLNNHNSGFNKLAGDIFNSRLAQANLIAKTDFDAKLSSLYSK